MENDENKVDDTADVNEQEPRCMATITYSIDNNGEYYVDIGIEDYESDTLDAFSSLVSSVNTMPFQIQTLDVAKTAFIKEDKEEEFEFLLQLVLVKSEEFLEKMQEKIKEDETDPCIKPTDMF